MISSARFDRSADVAADARWACRRPFSTPGRNPRATSSRAAADRHQGRTARAVLARRARHREHADARDRRYSQGDRRRCGDRRYLQTASRRGYRFIGRRTPVHRPHPDATDPFEEWVKGRLALDSLDSAQARRSGARVRANRRGAAALCARACRARQRLHAAVRADAIRARARSRACSSARCSAARQASTLDPSLGEGVGGAGLSAVRGGQDRRKARRRRGGPPRSNPTTGAITTASPTAPGARSGCAPSIER